MAVNTNCLAINNKNRKIDTGHDFYVDRVVATRNICGFNMLRIVQIGILRCNHNPNLDAYGKKLNEEATKLTVDGRYDFK